MSSKPLVSLVVFNYNEPEREINGTYSTKTRKRTENPWYIDWGIPFVLGLALGVVLMFTVDMFGFGLCIVGWLLLMLPILAYIPAFYKSLEYSIDDESVKLQKGVFWRKRVTVPFTKITNIDVTQGPVQRMFNIGSIQVQTAGASGQSGGQAELTMVGIRDTEGLKDTIMERVRGVVTPEPAVVKKEDVQKGDSDILMKMLKELTAIREALEKTPS